MLQCRIMQVMLEALLRVLHRNTAHDMMERQKPVPTSFPAVHMRRNTILARHAPAAPAPRVLSFIASSPSANGSPHRYAAVDLVDPFQIQPMPEQKPALSLHVKESSMASTPTIGAEHAAAGETY